MRRGAVSIGTTVFEIESGDEQIKKKMGTLVQPEAEGGSLRGAGARRGRFAAEDGPVKYAAHFTGERGLIAEDGGKS
jgi:hypothetical protein